MKYLLASCCLLFCLQAIHAQQPVGSWTFISGNYISPRLSNYKTKGTEYSTTRPATRDTWTSFTDAEGNFWLFGGGLANFSRNDFWRFRPSSGNWAWMAGDTIIAGTPSKNVFGQYRIPTPGAAPLLTTSASTWADSLNNFWAFGGGNSNNLWRYKIANRQWVWMGGDTTNNSPGVYGTKGIADPANRPGMRSSGVTWTDRKGMLWLFGGAWYNPYAGTEYYSDLWRLDPSTGNWAWMHGDKTPNPRTVYGKQGIADPSNKPSPATGGATWVDKAGNLWLFNGAFGNLWKYSVDANAWTFVSGDTAQNRNGSNLSPNYGTIGVAGITNQPANRKNALAWTDLSGNLWLYGGVGTGINGTVTYADLWKFDITSGFWTCVLANKPTMVLGTKSVSASQNAPGMRSQAGTWTDRSGNFWLQGGSGGNDLWKLNTATLQWAWMKGEYITDNDSLLANKGKFLPGAGPYASNTNSAWWPGFKGRFWLYSERFMYRFDPALRQWKIAHGRPRVPEVIVGTYLVPDIVWGEMDKEDSANSPGARQDAVTFTAKNGDLWYYGGRVQYFFDDLWKFNVQTEKWSWKGGTKRNTFSIGLPGYYGFKGYSDPRNSPGGRTSSVTWTDSLGNFWLFGGEGPTGSYNHANPEPKSDLWRYDMQTREWTWMAGPSVTKQKAVYGTRGVPGKDVNPTPGSGSSWTDKAGDLWLRNTGDSGVDIWKYTISTGQWTWMDRFKPSNNSVFGLRGIETSGNNPGARGIRKWSDANGDFCIFGDTELWPSVYRNDLWKLNSSTGNWTWIAGDTLQNQAGEYGIDDDRTAYPGGRSGAAVWPEENGKIWVFGGYGYSSSREGPESLNDMWLYTPAPLIPPFSFQQFSVTLQEDKPLLKWTTKNENKTIRFIVERSTDGIVFNELGNVYPNGSIAAYIFQDNEPVIGMNYYRIREVEQDSKFLLTGIESIEVVKRTTQFALGQNPVGNSLRLNLELESPQSVSIKITDLNGHQITSQEKVVTAGRNSWQIDVSRLRPGVYTVSIRSKDLNSVKRFVKN